MYEPRPIPWSHIQSWSCDACGECCRKFTVPLSMYEYAKICQTYGFNIAEIREGHVWLKKRVDKRCVFMISFDRLWLCGLQEEKPHACRIWPFRVTDHPKYGREARARYEGADRVGYLYVDPRCPRIIYCKPTLDFANKTVNARLCERSWLNLA